MGITPSYRAYLHTQRTLLRADGRTKPIDCSSNKPASSHLDLHYSIQYSSACGQRIFRESDRINSPTCQSSASGSPLYELAITTFPPALFFVSQSQDLSNHKCVFLADQSESVELSNKLHFSFANRMDVPGLATFERPKRLFSSSRAGLCPRTLLAGWQTGNAMQPLWRLRSWTISVSPLARR